MNFQQYIIYSISMPTFCTNKYKYPIQIYSMGFQQTFNLNIHIRFGGFFDYMALFICLYAIVFVLIFPFGIISKSIRYLSVGYAGKNLAGSR